MGIWGSLCVVFGFILVAICIIDLIPPTEPNRFSNFRIVKYRTTKENEYFVVQHKTGILIRIWRNCTDCIGLDYYCTNIHDTYSEAERYLKRRMERVMPPERLTKIIKKY